MFWYGLKQNGVVTSCSVSVGAPIDAFQKIDPNWFLLEDYDLKLIANISKKNYNNNKKKGLKTI